MGKTTIRVRTVGQITPSRIIPVQNIRDVEEVPENVPVYADGVRAIVNLKGQRKDDAGYFVRETVEEIEAMMNGEVA